MFACWRLDSLVPDSSFQILVLKHKDVQKKNNTSDMINWIILSTTSTSLSIK